MTMLHEPPTSTIVAPQVLLGNHLKALKLPTFAREYEKVAMESAQDRADYPRYLLRLCELERIDRERRTIERRIRLARFPQVKSLDTFDFVAQPSLNKPLVLELARCEWIEKRHNCIALGPSGADSAEVAQASRDDLARHSGMISPTAPISSRSGCASFWLAYFLASIRQRGQPFGSCFGRVRRRLSPARSIRFAL